jgi:hypothetical protein
MTRLIWSGGYPQSLGDTRLRGHDDESQLRYLPVEWINTVQAVSTKHNSGISCNGERRPLGCVGLEPRLAGSCSRRLSHAVIWISYVAHHASLEHTMLIQVMVFGLVEACNTYATM